MSKEVLISEIRVAPGAIITKGHTNTGRKGFILPVTYVTAEGREHATHIACERKKDVLPRLQRDRDNAASGAMTASYDDHGNYWGTRTAYWIGPRGLKPSNAA